MDHDDIVIYEQGLKRLKEVLPEGRSDQPMDFRTRELSYKHSHPVSHKSRVEVHPEGRSDQPMKLHSLCRPTFGICTGGDPLGSHAEVFFQLWLVNLTCKVRT